MTDSTPDSGTALTTNEAASLLLVPDEQQVPEPLPAGDEPAPQTTETDADPEQDDAGEVDQSDDSQDQPEEVSEEPEEPTYRVKIDGVEQTVTLSELQKGYSRTADYTRKAQALAEQRKAAEAEFQAVRQEREHYAQTLAAVEETLAGQKLPEPDWDKLYRENPVEFAVQQARHRQHLEAEQAVQAERQRVHQQMIAEQRQHLQQHLQQEATRLIERIPEWKTPEVAKAEKQRITEYAKEVGYSDQELAQIYDSRAVSLMRKAMLYDEIQSRKPVAQRKVEAAPRMIQPGQAQRQNSKTSEKSRLQQRLSKTGSVSDAAQLIMLGD